MNYILTFAGRSRTPSCGSGASPLGGLHSSHPGWLSTGWGCWDERRETSNLLSTSLCGDRKDRWHVCGCLQMKDSLLLPRRSSFCIHPADPCSAAVSIFFLSFCFCHSVSQYIIQMVHYTILSSKDVPAVVFCFPRGQLVVLDMHVFHQPIK